MLSTKDLVFKERLAKKLLDQYIKKLRSGKSKKY